MTVSPTAISAQFCSAPGLTRTVTCGGGLPSLAVQCGCVEGICSNKAD